jgi:PTH1 family peptidyl-tRNA hydrolase
MRAIVGLGNPGEKYEHTRHNVGFDVISIIAAKLNAPIKKLKFQGVIGETQLGGDKLVLIKPQTFMNLSGNSIYEIVRFYKIEPDHVIVIYDDLDLPVGTVRIRKQGGTGGHNGMKSIIYQLQTEEFPRIRIGIDKPEGDEVIDYVLHDFLKSEQEPIFEALQKAALAVECMIRENVDMAMNKYNVKNIDCE